MLTTQLPHFDGDYWPGMIKSFINDVSAEERRVVEKEEEAEKAKKATMIEVTKRKRKRRKRSRSRRAESSHKGVVRSHLLLSRRSQRTPHMVSMILIRVCKIKLCPSWLSD